MKDALRNYLKENDEVVAVYCKIASNYDKPCNEYKVVFHQDGGGRFSITESFTEEELTKAKRYWKFVEDWYEVKSIREILKAKVISGHFTLIGVSEAVENTWEQWKRDGFINCKGEDD